MVIEITCFVLTVLGLFGLSGIYIWRGRVYRRLLERHDRIIKLLDDTREELNKEREVG